MKKIRALVASLLSAALMCTAASAATFPDVDANAEYAAAIECVQSVGIMSGYGDGTFQPNKKVSRAELASVLCRMLGEGDGLVSDSTLFTDVPTTHWANGVVAKAVELGLVSGYGNGKFGPDDSVTYEQALTMAVNMLGLGDKAGEAGGYPDGYISVSEERGFTEGLSGNKGDAMKRWQIAVLCYNVMMRGGL